ncbi:MAG: T9SS type A sorting domain-containing protein [Bacteroidales bacterium]
MRHKKLKLSVILLLGIGLTGLQAQTMYVRQTSGTQTAYSLSNIKKMNFSSGNIIINKATGVSDTYALTDIRYLNFQDLTSNIALVEKQEGTIQLYPNPVVDFLNIEVYQTLSQSYVIEILSIDGRYVYKEKINGQNKGCQINVSVLPQGMYFCKVNNGITTKTMKFIKN